MERRDKPTNGTTAGRLALETTANAARGSIIGKEIMNKLPETITRHPSEAVLLDGAHLLVAAEPDHDFGSKLQATRKQFLAREIESELKGLLRLMFH